jgi:hypothetical protein
MCVQEMCVQSVRGREEMCVRFARGERDVRPVCMGKERCASGCCDGEWGNRDLEVVLESLCHLLPTEPACLGSTVGVTVRGNGREGGVLLLRSESN